MVILNLNLLGNVISFTNVGRKIESLATAGEFTSLMSEYGTLVRLILFSVRPLEVKSNPKLNLEPILNKRPIEYLQ